MEASGECQQGTRVQMVCVLSARRAPDCILPVLIICVHALQEGLPVACFNLLRLFAYTRQILLSVTTAPAGTL